MSVYVMSDIHGMYVAFRAMINKLKFTDDDTLEDVIDKGSLNQSFLNEVKTIIT